MQETAVAVEQLRPTPVVPVPGVAAENGDEKVISTIFHLPPGVKNFSVPEAVAWTCASVDPASTVVSRAQYLLLRLTRQPDRY